MLSRKQAFQIRAGIVLARAESRRERQISKKTISYLTEKAYHRERGKIMRRMGPPRGAAGVSRPDTERGDE